MSNALFNFSLHPLLLPQFKADLQIASATNLFRGLSYKTNPLNKIRDQVEESLPDVVGIFKPLVYTKMHMLAESNKEIGWSIFIAKTEKTYRQRVSHHFALRVVAEKARLWVCFDDLDIRWDQDKELEAIQKAEQLSQWLQSVTPLNANYVKTDPILNIDKKDYGEQKRG